MCVKASDCAECYYAAVGCCFQTEESRQKCRGPKVRTLSGCIETRYVDPSTGIVPSVQEVMSDDYHDVISGS